MCIVKTFDAGFVTISSISDYLLESCEWVANLVKIVHFGKIESLQTSKYNICDSALSAGLFAKQLTKLSPLLAGGSCREYWQPLLKKEGVPYVAEYCV